MNEFAPLLPRSPWSYIDNQSIFIRNMCKSTGPGLTIFNRLSLVRTRE